MSHLARWEVSRGSSAKRILNHHCSLSGKAWEEHVCLKRFSPLTFFPPTTEMHASLLSDHAFNQLFRQKTKVCTEPWIMEGEKAERRMEVRNRGVQWQEVSLAQIFLLWQTAKSLLRSSHWREANRCRRRLSRKIYSVHSHLFTRTQRHRQTASTWNLTGGKNVHMHTLHKPCCGRMRA